MVEIIGTSKVVLNGKEYNWNITKESLQDKEYKEYMVDLFYSIGKLHTVITPEVAEAFIKEPAVNASYKIFKNLFDNEEDASKELFVVFLIMATIDMFRQEIILNKSIYYAFKNGNNLSDNETKKIVHEFVSEYNKNIEKNAGFHLFLIIIFNFSKNKLIEVITPDIIEKDKKKE